MSLNKEITKLCNESLNELFSKKYWENIRNKKETQGNSDPLYSDADGRMAFIIHAVRIRSGVILERLYFEAIKNCCPHSGKNFEVLVVFLIFLNLLIAAVGLFLFK